MNRTLSKPRNWQELFNVFIFKNNNLFFCPRTMRAFGGDEFIILVCSRVADNQHERVQEHPRKTHPSLFWSKYWKTGARLPSERDHYDHSSGESSVRTKSLRNNRLDPRHVRLQPGEAETFDGSNALKLKSSCDSLRSIPSLVFLSLALIVRVRL